jgi:drug/metabolite transporter (DMT)-like permease
MSRAAPLMALVAGASAIAFAPILVRLTGTGPAAAGFWRLALALPALAVMGALGARGGPMGAWRPRPLTMLAGLFFALDLGFWHYGIKLTTVANATILANLSPVFVTAGAWLMLRERPGRGFLAGLALALAGSGIIAAARGGGHGVDPGLGDGLSLITAVWYAGYMLSVRAARFAQDASQVMFWTSLAGAPLMLTAAVVLREPIAPVSTSGWLACMGLGAVHITGQGAITWALGRLPAATASVIVLVQPPIAAVLGYLIFAEPMSGLQMAGGAVALAGVALAQVSAARAAPSPANPAPGKAARVL